MRSSKPVVILVLLVLAIVINYIDRGSLPLVAKNVAGEFSFDKVEMGWVLSAFSFSYAICHLGAGWLVDRYDVKWVYALGFVLWSVATVGMGLATGFASFILLRILLGAGESVAYPATSRVIVANFNEQQRGMANALVDAGTKVGPALSMLFGGLFVSQFGWRALFFTVGIGGLLWLLPWLIAVPNQSPTTRTAAEKPAAIPMFALLKKREVWGTSLGFFCLGYVWFFLLSWTPSYLQEARGFTEKEMGVFGSLPFWAMAVTSLSGGWFSDRLIRSGGSVTKVRKSFLIGGFVLCAVFLYPAVLVKSATACVILLVAACASLGFYTSNAWAVTQSLAGPSAAGQWTGLQNFVGNLGGALSPVLTGWLVKQSGSYAQSFLASVVVLLIGVVIYITLVPRVEPLHWEEK